MAGKPGGGAQGWKSARKTACRRQRSTCSGGWYPGYNSKPDQGVVTGWPRHDRPAVRKSSPASDTLKHVRSCSSMTAACVLVGGMTLAVPGATGFVAPAQPAGTTERTTCISGTVQGQ